MRVYLNALLLTITALVIRVSTAGWGGLSCDEANCASIASAASWGEMFDYIKNDGNAPLMYVIMRLWATVFGDGDLSFRILAVLVSTALSPASYLVLRRSIGERLAIETALLVAFSAPLVQFGNLVRPYGLLPLFGLLSTDRLIKLLNDPKSRVNAVLYSALIAGAVYLHHWGAMLAIGHVALAVTGLACRWWSIHAVKIWFVASFCACLLYLPWVPVLVYGLINDVSPWIDRRQPYTYLLLTAVESLSGYREKPVWWHWTVVAWANCAFWSALMVPVVIRRTDGTPIFVSRQWQIPVAGGLTAAVVIDQVRSFWRDRYLTVFAPLLLLLHAAVADRLTGRLSKRYRWALPIVLWLPIWIPQLVFFHRFPESSAWALMEQLARQVDPADDLVVVSFEAIAPQVDRYLPESVPVLCFPDLHRVKVIRWAGLDSRMRDQENLLRLIGIMKDKLAAGGNVWLVESYHKYVAFPLRYPVGSLTFNSVEAVRMCQIRAWLEAHAEKTGKDLWAPGREFSVMASRFSPR